MSLEEDVRRLFIEANADEVRDLLTQAVTALKPFAKAADEYEGRPPHWIVRTELGMFLRWFIRARDVRVRIMEFQKRE